MVSSRLHTKINYNGIIMILNIIYGGIIMAVVKTQFTLRLEPADHAKIKIIAKNENRSMTNMIETLIKNAIKQYENKNGEIELTDEDLFIE